MIIIMKMAKILIRAVCNKINFSKEELDLWD